MIAAIVVGMIAGIHTKRSVPAGFWSVVIAAAAFFSTVREVRYGIELPLSWTVVGLLVGAFCGAIPYGKPIWRIVIGAIVGGSTMAGFGAFHTMHPEFTFDLICAPIVGALIGLLIELVEWVESHMKWPRYVTAVWVLSAVIVGNWLS